jgi:hypothetical protein
MDKLEMSIKIRLFFVCHPHVKMGAHYHERLIYQGGNCLNH